MSVRLPPPLVLRPEDGPSANSTQFAVRVTDPEAADTVRAQTFGAVLARSRAERGLLDLDQPLEIFATADSSRSTPTPPAEHVWVPHMFCWQKPAEAALAWELCDENAVEARLGRRLEDVVRWAARPNLLLRLAALAADRPAYDVQSPDQHLSFRWLLAHQEEVAELLSGSVVALEHVSLHVTADEEARVIQALTGALGLVEIPRPAGIAIPGCWLQAGHCRVHLNSRTGYEREQGFPGTAPNHICFAVADLTAAEQAVKAAGFATRRAGSLGDQVWFRLASGSAVELQPMGRQGGGQP